jgi:hypothetical protein
MALTTDFDDIKQLISRMEQGVFDADPEELSRRLDALIEAVEMHAYLDRRAAQCLFREDPRADCKGRQT